MPTLVICGGNDWITPLSKSEQIVAGIPGSRLEVFDKSGHMPMLEEPEKFISVLRSFLARAGRAPIQKCRHRRSRNRDRVTAMPFTLRNLKQDLEDVGSNFDGPPDLEFRLATDALELEQSGLCYQRIPPGYRFPYGHTHKGRKRCTSPCAGAGA